MRGVAVGEKVCLGSGLPLVWIVGPGAGEDESRLALTAERLKKLSEQLDLPLVFRAGRGVEKATGSCAENRRELLFEKLAWIRSQFGLPVMGEVESVDDLEAAGPLLDLIQIPDFLCEQDSLLAAAIATGRPVSVRRAQSVSPEALSGATAERARGAGGGVLLTEAGVSFGYEQTLADMTMIPRLRALGWPVVFDLAPLDRRLVATGLRQPGLGASRAALLRAAIAAGAAAVSFETGAGLADAEQAGPSLEALEELMQEGCRLGEWMRLRGYA